MASASVSHSVHNENHCSNDFKKTVFLEDWWLVKAEKDIEGKRLAVAGFTYRDEHQARRMFSSAPILKIYDVFTLETTDGICVILEGFINKTRTIENGFTADVFDHFLFGFPPQWEYAEKCMSEGFTSNNLFSRSPNSGKKFKGAEGCENILKENEQHSSDCIESSVEIPKKSEVDLRSGVSIADVQQTNDNSESVNAPKIHENFLDNTTRQPTVDLPTGTSVLEKNVIASPSETPNIHISAGQEESISKCERKLILKTNRKVTFIEGDNGASELVKNLEKENLNDKSSNLPEEVSSHSSPFDDEVEDPKAAITIANPNKESVKLSSSEGNKKRGKSPGKKASISKNATTTKKSAKRVLKYESPVTQGGKKKASILSPESSLKKCRSGLEENGVAPPAEATDINIGANKGKGITRKYQRKRNLKFNNAENEGLEALDILNKKSSNMPEEISSHSTLLDPELQQDRTDEINPDAKNIRVSSTGAKQKKDKNCGEKASITRNNTERVHKYESPLTGGRSQKEFILSPESLSSKRSRSGRLLLPTLEFWRNQTALYDADRHITGIKQEQPADYPSRGSKSKSKRKRK